MKFGAQLFAALLWLALSVFSTTADATLLPVRAGAGSVIVHAEAGLDDLADELARKAPQVLAEIARDLPGLPRPAKVEIRLVKSASSLSAVAPGGRRVPEWAVGVAFRGTGVVAVATRRNHNPVDVHSTLAHELAHLSLDTAFGEVPIPRWLNEGFAYLHSSDFSFERSRTLTGMAWTGDVIPLAEIDSRFPAQELAAHRAYAESYDFVAFLAYRGRYLDADDDGDRWPFRDFLAEIASGKTIDEAAREAYATGIKDLFGEWSRAMRDRYMLAPIGMFGIGLWVIGAFLLVLGYLRKRRLNRATMNRWEREEDLQAERVALARAHLRLLEEDEDDEGDELRWN